MPSNVFLTLLYLLTQPCAPDFDKGFVLDVLATIEREHIGYALPFLIGFAFQEGKSEAGQMAYNLVQSFSPPITQRYAIHITLLTTFWEKQTSSASNERVPEGI